MSGRHSYWSTHSWSPITVVFFLPVSSPERRRLASRPPGTRGFSAVIDANQATNLGDGQKQRTTERRRGGWRNVVVVVGARHPFTGGERQRPPSPNDRSRKETANEAATTASPLRVACRLASCGHWAVLCTSVTNLPVPRTHRCSPGPLAPITRYFYGICIMKLLFLTIWLVNAFWMIDWLSLRTRIVVTRRVLLAKTTALLAWLSGAVKLMPSFHVPTCIVTHLP